MSLADIYANRFANAEASEKTASSEEEQKIAAALDQFTEQDCAKLSAASDMLDAYGMEYESGLDKLAAAGQVVDFLSQEVDDEAGEGGGSGEGSEGSEGSGNAENASEEDAEKTASEFEAAGRIMARAFHDESEKIGSGEGAAPDSFASRIAVSLGK